MWTNEVYHIGKEFLFFWMNIGFFTYGALLLSFYFVGIFLANKAIIRNKKRALFLQVSDIVSATDIPSVSLVAPAYNEGMTIIENVKSLLAIQYPFYELIIVNDGSKDDSLEKLIREFDLEQRDATFITQPIPTASVNHIYKSLNKKYAQLTVIDKNNGGRADAINAGVNFANTELVLCTDADCIIEQDALLKMVRPYLEEDDKEIIACGGGIGIANDSIVQEGILKELRLPDSFVPTVQVVEYMRAFLLGRMAWSEINGLMLVSGAFGMYPRKRMIEVGGFDPKSIGEDLELCMRLRMHMEDQKLPYKVVYIPETLCWTEAPPDYKIFIKQRDRWARGLWDTLKKHRKLFLNPKYRQMGIFYYPYWLFFEFGAPVVEAIGLIVIIVSTIFGWLNWHYAILLFGLVYILGCIFSTAAIFMYVRSFDHYKQPKQIIELLLAAYLEPFLFHPVLVYGQLKGYYKNLFGIKSGWGTMTRKGFKASDA